MVQPAPNAPRQTSSTMAALKTSPTWPCRRASISSVAACSRSSRARPLGGCCPARSPTKSSTSKAAARLCRHARCARIPGAAAQQLFLRTAPASRCPGNGGGQGAAVAAPFYLPVGTWRVDAAPRGVARAARKGGLRRDPPRVRISPCAGARARAPSAARSPRASPPGSARGASPISGGRIRLSWSRLFRPPTSAAATASTQTAASGARRRRAATYLCRRSVVQPLRP